MFSLAKSRSVRSWGFWVAGLAIVIMATGVGLLADIPGPKPDTDVRVKSFGPDGLTDRSVNITVRFTNDLVDPDSLNRPLARVPVEITPEIDGVARWTAPDLLTIFPGRPLAPATRYKAKVKAGGGYLNGNAVKRDETFEFRTRPLSAKVVRYQAQRTRGSSRHGRLVFDLEFNYPVEREALKKVLRVLGRDGATNSEPEIIWSDTTFDGAPLPSRAEQFRISTGLFELVNAAQKYQLIIDKGLRCVECGDGLPVEYAFTMTVHPNPRLDLRVEEVRAERAGKQGSILVMFSSDVPTEEARDYVKIEPTIPFSVSGYWRGVRLLGDFEPQTVYTVTITPGIMSRDGELMEHGSSHRVVMGNLQPEVRFTSPGLYLPREGSQLLEIGTVNIDTVSIEVSQVFSNNLVTYTASGADNSWGAYSINPAYGRGTFIKDYPLEHEKNVELISTIDLGEIIGDTLKGVFVVAARSRSSRWVHDTRHAMITDIGILARMSKGYLMVWANSLATTEPIGKAKVKLFSRNNQLLAEGKTNSKGVALFPELAEQIAGFQPFLISVEKNDDLSYLRLDNTRLPTSDFDVSGRPFLDDGYEAFLYLDRGVFRPGDTARLVSMVRGDRGDLPGAFPYLLKIVDPRGRTFREFRANTEHAMEGLDIPLSVDVPTGKYAAVAYLTDTLVLGRAEFLVEEFVPDRIKVSVNTDRTDYRVGDTVEINVDGQMLYGAPAAGMKVTSEIVLTPARFQPSGFSSYNFRRIGQEESVSRIKLNDTLLSDSGTVTLKHVIARGYHPSGMLTAQFWATVSETGGRGVSSYVERAVHPYPRYLGIKTNLESYARTGNPVTANLVALRSDGSVCTVDSVHVEFSRLVYNSMLRREADGSYRFVSERTEEPVDSNWVDIGPDGGVVSFTPAAYGRYRITATDRDGGHSTAVEFYASGWGQVPWSLEEPDRLQLDLDKEQYSPGSRAKLQVRAPFGGRLLVTVENQAVQDYLVVDLPENTGEVELPIKSEYAPNAYVAATLIRPANKVSKGMPARAYGLIPLKVTSEERRLKVDLTTLKEMRPNADLTVKIATDGSADARLTVAAVDAGVLQLTNFTTPDPFGFFCGQRRPALEGYDLYSQVYPETERATSHLSPPGGVYAYRSKQHLNPFQARRINVVALWSGVVEVDSNGFAEVTMHVPKFNGQLVVMAVGCDGPRFGAATSNLLVREPIILQESFPRFIAPGDEVRGLVTAYSGLDSAANVTITADLKGRAKIVGEHGHVVMLEPGRPQAVEFLFRGEAAPGKVEVAISAEAGEEKSLVEFEMANRPANPLTTQFGSGVVTDGAPVTFRMPDNWVSATAHYTLRTSSLAALQLSRNIEYLLRYPYGCVEQTTSRLFPLLYFDDLAKMVRPELLGGTSHEYFLSEGIAKLTRMQHDDGSFSYWPGRDQVHTWSSIYASHFLIEAKLAGYEYDRSTYRRTLKYLKNVARDRHVGDLDAELRTYACFVLAKAGELDNKLFNYLSGLNTSELPAYSAYFTASALALAGDIEAAKEIVPFDVQPDLAPPEDGGNFSSGVRNDAILLDLLLQVDPENPSVAVLARSLLERSRLGRWYNTQETSFALMALGKYFSKTKLSSFTGTVTVDVNERYDIDTADFVLTNDSTDWKEIEIAIDGGGPCFYFWQASGVPLAPEVPDFARGISVHREYLDASGKRADLQTVRLGDRLVGHIAIKATGRSLENIVIADLLPAGFEIENSRLANTPEMPWLPPNPKVPDYQDIRDDRLLMFVNLPERVERHYYYAVRAIAAGDFVVPPVAAECMYNPTVAGASSSGRLVVTR